MAKKPQSFADKVAKVRGSKRNMAKLVVAEKKPNGSYSFRTRMVDAGSVKDELANAKA
ncbi:MAG TPA: hypothetical protein VMO47_12815 [Rhodothermales bacterium]|nr:hypothetical protein [Rhodothermales bacterium]